MLNRSNTFSFPFYLVALLSSHCASTNTPHLNATAHCAGPPLQPQISSPPAVVVPVVAGRGPCVAPSTVSVTASNAPPPAIVPVARGTATPLGRTCDQLAREGDALRARFGVVGTPAPTDEIPASISDVLEPIGKCYAAGDGAWAVTAHNVVKQTLSAEEGGGETMNGEWSLVWVTALGRKVPLAAARAPGVLSHGAVSADWVKPLFTFDYDGNGTSELVVKSGGFNTEESQWEHHSIYKVNNTGTPAWWVLGFEGRIKDFLDADHDARPDIVLRSAFVYSTPCGLQGIDYYGPLELEHSLANGDFTDNDEVTRAYLQLACPAMPTEFITPPESTDGFDPEKAIHAVACAHYLGATNYAIVRRVMFEFERNTPFNPAQEHDSEDSCRPLAPLLHALDRVEQVRIGPLCEANPTTSTSSAP